MSSSSSSSNSVIASEAFRSANSLFVDADYEAALEKYNEAIAADAEQAEYYVKRAACHLQLENYDAAIDDADEAIARRSEDAQARINKGIGLFHRGQYTEAKSAFEAALARQSDSRPARTWLRKCEAELDAAAGGAGVATSEAVTTSTAATPVTADAAAAAAPPPPPPPSSSSSSSSSSSTADGAPRSRGALPASAAVLPPTTPIIIDPTKARFEWFQSATNVTVAIFAKGIKEEEAQIRVTATRITAEIQLEGGREFQMDLDLFAPVQLTGIRYLPTKVEIKMDKLQPGHWPALERIAEAAASAASRPKVESTAAAGFDPKRYPSSSSKKHDWDSLAHQIEEESKSEKPEGDAALQQLLAGIYSKATDDTRRAMMKSYYESGGTVLSTNWDEVGKKKVEGSAPEGMEMHTWSELSSGKKK